MRAATFSAGMAILAMSIVNLVLLFSLSARVRNLEKTYGVDVLASGRPGIEQRFQETLVNDIAFVIRLQKIEEFLRTTTPTFKDVWDIDPPP